MEPNQNPQANQQQVQVRISDEILKGTYSNQAMIRHTKQEFVIDFLNFVPGDTNAVVSSRIFLSPEHMKGLFAALEENLKKYESQFGAIKATDLSGQNFGFRTE